jgi:hypothetical protein
MDEQNVEDRFVCVWLDNQLMRSEDYIDTQDQIRTIIKAFLNFKDSNQCVDFITDTTDAKIFFITTNVLGKILVPIIHFFEQIHSIYIFYTKKSSDEDWTKDYKKIKGIYNDIIQICDRFKQDATITCISFKCKLNNEMTIKTKQKVYLRTLFFFYRILLI